MTLMRASVVDAAEANIALDGGADIVDCVDAARNALGAVPPMVARAAFAAAKGRAATSAALGDPLSAETARALIAAGATGLRLAVDAATLEAHGETLERLARETALSGVLWVDRGADLGLLARLAALGFKGAELGVEEPASGRLFNHVDAARVDAFVTHCRALGLASALSGSLEPPDIPRLLLSEPDILGFSSALRAPRQRKGRLDRRAVALIRDLVPREAPPSEASPSRPPAAPHAAAAATDLVFVRDVIALTPIGAYAHERGLPQRVRFSVEATVRRTEAGPRDMRDVFSYDLILDAIRLATARGHVEFVEVLAEAVAATVLKHPRVVAVRARVEKLDVIEGAVGVEIVRTRSG